MTFGSLFAGIGGMDLGLERAGMTCRWQVEIDPYARRVLSKHWPDVPKYEDVRDVGAHNLATVDLICGGFPCQDISNAGKRAGIDGERSGLWSEYARIIRELRPRYVLVENVAALLARGVERVLGDLADIGYDAEWSVLPASALGAPHRRDRLFIAAYPCGTGRSGLVAVPDPCPPGPWRLRGEEDLCAIASAPFEPGDRWPRPLVRRVDDVVPGRVERHRGIGNAVAPAVAEHIGRLIVQHATGEQAA